MTDEDDIFIIPLGNNSFTFDKTGLWKFKLDFKVNNTSLIWRHIGNHIFQTFKPIKYYDEEMDPLIFFNYYCEEIPIITVSDALQITNINTMQMQVDILQQQSEYLNKSAESMEKQTKYLNQSAEAQRGTANSQIVLTIATGFLAAFTAAMAYAASRSAKFTKESVDETRKYRKRKSIMKVIRDIINIAIIEFNLLKSSINYIKDDIIITLPEHLNTPINRSSWLDFEVELPDKYNEINEYLRSKGDYNRIRSECIDLIKEYAKIRINQKSGILVSLGKWMSKNGITGKATFFFEENILESFPECILLKTAEDQNRETKVLFNRYIDIWLDIRKEFMIKDRISQLKKLANQMERYILLEVELNNKKIELMKNYVITHDHLEIFKLDNRVE